MNEHARELFVAFDQSFSAWYQAQAELRAVEERIAATYSALDELEGQQKKWEEQVEERRQAFMAAHEAIGKLTARPTASTVPIAKAKKKAE
jgi:flagellar biosynthesis chaperone FliJ